jgi:hypothetical protein
MASATAATWSSSTRTHRRSDLVFSADVQRAVDPVKPAKRSLSAIGWTLKAKTDGFPLVHHSVFFGHDYPEEFDAVFQRSSYPSDPTVYICAQDRADTGGLADPDKAERMLMVINAPPNGDQNPDQSEMEQCMERSLARLEACGLKVDVEPAMSVPTGPEGFNRLFPATGGALYGRANHSPFASFQRPDNRTKIPGLYLAGGSVHPGPGVPMAALSGRLAAARIVVRPCFNTPVAPDGYRWWYVDGLSDDGRHGLSVIAFVGSVFSPYYAWSGRKDPYDHISINVALYGPKARWAMTERGKGALDDGPDHFAVGPSALHWEGNTLVIDVNEVTVPWPSRLRGQIRFTPDVSQPTPFALDTSERHHWWPYAPFGHIEAHFEQTQPVVAGPRLCRHQHRIGRA